MSMTDKPSREDVLKVMVEPFAIFCEWGNWGQYHDEHDPMPTSWDDEPPTKVTKLYNEAQLLAMYAAGAEEMRELAAKVCDGYIDPKWICSAAIRALPITPTNTMTSWICPRCKVDRLKTTCPDGSLNCPMQATAQTNTEGEQA